MHFRFQVEDYGLFSFYLFNHLLYILTTLVTSNEKKNEMTPPPPKKNHKKKKNTFPLKTQKNPAKQHNSNLSEVYKNVDFYHMNPVHSSLLRYNFLVEIIVTA